MKILWLCPYPLRQISSLYSHHLSHPSTWIVNLSKQLAKQNDVDLHIVTSNAHVPKSTTIARANITYHIIKYSFPFTTKGFPHFFPLDTICWYKPFIENSSNYIKDISPDIVHAHGTEKGYALSALKSGFPHIISIQGVISLIHKINPTLKTFFQVPIEKYSIKNAKYFGVRTLFDRGFVKSINKEAILYEMPEIIGDHFFTNKWQVKNSRRIVFVGSILKRKGVELLIDALSEVRKVYPNIQLTFVGAYDKRYYFKLIRIIERLELSKNIDFIGPVNNEKITGVLCDSDLFILPSYIDNSPNSLAEAMALGVPCIASNIGGIPSMITHNYDGLIFSIDSKSNLVENILKLLSDKNLQLKLSNNARETAFNRNYKTVVAQQTLNTYCKVLNES